MLHGTVRHDCAILVHLCSVRCVTEARENSDLLGVGFSTVLERTSIECRGFEASDDVFIIYPVTGVYQNDGNRMARKIRQKYAFTCATNVE